MNWKGIVPIVADWSQYNQKLFRADLLAGLTVCIMLVPQGMAYALLAGMPPIYGLYGGLVPLFVYGLLGTSKQLSIGPVAISALLVLAGISQLAEPGSTEYISLVILTGLLVGLLQFLLSVLRLGFLVSFLSHPVIIGFTAAAAVIIAISQLKYLFGFSIPRFSHSYETVGYAFSHLSEIHWPSFLLCGGGIICILLFRRINRSIPGALIISILGVLAVYFFNLHQIGVKVVGEVPVGLPAPQFPEWSLDNIYAVMPTVLTVAIIGVVESISIAKVLEAKNRDYTIRPNQELLALGVSKIVGAFFQALPSSGSFTRSAVNDDAGAKTGMASVIAALGIGLTLLFLTSVFYYLPEAILAAIVLVAVKGLFNIKEAKMLWEVHRPDFMMMIATFLATLLLGIEEGILLGVLLSIGMIIFRTTNPHMAILGHLPGTDHYRNISRFENAVQPDKLLIVRFDAQLYFGNADYFKNTLIKILEECEACIDTFILDASSIQAIDSSGLHALEEVYKTFSQAGVRFVISGLIGPARDILYKTNFIQKVREENFFMNVHEAVRFAKQEKKGQLVEWTPNAIQTNLSKKQK